MSSKEKAAGAANSGKSTSYDPKEIEARVYKKWEENNVFTPRLDAARVAKHSEKFIMVIPPPNVTGSLHIGHALTVAIEDAIARWKRMCGFVTLWVPGIDHAGIATQTVVEKHIQKHENKTRHDFSREEFISKVWKWKDTYGNRIIEQLRSMGCSVDWSREVFTMDSQRSKAVTHAFVRMYDAGIIYRASRLVSWCSHLRTALSEIEVDTEEIDKPTKIKVPGYPKPVEVGYLWNFCYQLKKDPIHKRIEVSTTRIETMLGDTAVAVHPEDERYKDLIGEELLHPFVEGRVMKIIADAEVDMEFGTGAVKITPAHDKNDYEMGRRHKLETINIFTEDGKINEVGGELFAGMHRFECREVIEKKLKELGLLVGKFPNQKKMFLPVCSRSHDIIEYMPLPQWYVDCKQMAARAVEAVKSGDLKLIPSSFDQTWFQWLENIRDWCISRQLLWGHQIPIYRVVSPLPKGESEDIWVPGIDFEDAERRAKARLGVEEVQLMRDQDVLDTWFSSGLFPFSVMGWPDETEDMKLFFPNTLLETGRDILFFWVARMVMMSLQLTDQLPFKEVYLHAMIRDAHGHKMSKSKGNVIDPIEVINGVTLEELHEKIREGNLPASEVKRSIELQKKDFPSGIPECGADALRYGLLAYTMQGRSINLDINRIVSYRYFCNKLWNAVKFASLHFPEGFKAEGVLARLMGMKKAGKVEDGAGVCDVGGSGLDWSDEWILDRFSECARLSNLAFEEYNFSDAVTHTYNFWLYDFCDVYLEVLKPRFASLKEGDQAERLLICEVLYACLEGGLRLLHPLMPFVTEELYGRLPDSYSKYNLICQAKYPEESIMWKNNSLNSRMKLILLAARSVRALMLNLELTQKDDPKVYINCKSSLDAETFRSSSLVLHALIRISQITALDAAKDTRPEGCISDAIDDKIEILLDFKESGNVEQTFQKLVKKEKSCKKALATLIGKSQAAQSSDKVSKEVLQTYTTKLEQLEEKHKALELSVKIVEGILHAQAE